MKEKEIEKLEKIIQAEFDREIFRSVWALLEKPQFLNISLVRNPEPCCKIKRREPKFNQGW